MRAPLLPDEQDDEDVVRIGVTARGTSAALLLHASNGNVTFVPGQGVAPYCFGLAGGWHTKRHEISGDAVLGAALEGPNTLQIWYLHRRRWLRKTPPLQCESGQEAARMVAAVRAAASRWARGGPPRVLAIVEPHAMSAFTARVLPIWEGAAGLAVTTVAARGPAHAGEALRAADLAAADVAAIVGCDAAFSEALQGLLSRGDWEEASRHLPLAHVPVARPPRLPGGAGAGGAAGDGTRGGGGVRLARAAGLAGLAPAAWAVVKGALAQRDVASVLQPPGRRRYMLLSFEAGGGPLDVLLHRTTTVDAAWLPWAGPPTPAFTPVPSPSPYGLAPAGSPKAARAAAAAGGRAAACAECDEGGPPLAHVKRLAESRAMLGPRPPAAPGSAGAAAALFSSPLAHSIPSGWCSRLQLRVHNLGVGLASAAAPPPPLGLRGGSDGGAALEGAAPPPPAAQGLGQLRVVCAAEGRGVKGHVRAIRELLRPLETPRASTAGGGPPPAPAASRPGSAGSGGARRPPSPGAQRLLPIVMTEQVGAAAFTPTGLASMRLVVDSVKLPPPAPGAATLVEVHPALIYTTAGPARA